MSIKKTRIVGLLIVMLITGIAGCASGPELPKWDPYSLIWPLPPERPRIKYADTLQSEYDVRKKEASSFADSIFGVEGPEEFLIKPYGVTTDGAGRVFISDVGRVLAFDKQKGVLDTIGSKGVGKLIRPLGMYYDRSSNLLYVTDSGVDRVIIFNSDGLAVSELGQNNELKDPSGVVVDPKRDRIYVANTKHHVISVFDRKGKFIKNLSERGSDDGKLNFPTQVTLDSDGNIYVVDFGNFRIQILDPEGNFISKVGSVGMSFGSFARPKSVSLDPDGNIYVVDSRFHGVTIFSKKGELLLTWGTRGSERGLFEQPSSIHIDEKGFIYVVSQVGRKVDVFQYITYPDEKTGPNAPASSPAPAGSKPAAEAPSNPAAAK